MSQLQSYTKSKTSKNLTFSCTWIYPGMSYCLATSIMCTTTDRIVFSGSNATTGTSRTWVVLFAASLGIFFFGTFCTETIRRSSFIDQTIGSCWCKISTFAPCDWVINWHTTSTSCFILCTPSCFILCTGFFCTWTNWSIRIATTRITTIKIWRTSRWASGRTCWWTGWQKEDRKRKSKEKRKKSWLEYISVCLQLKIISSQKEYTKRF